MKALIGFFVRRPLLVNLLMVFVLLTGYLVMQSQEYSAYPSMDLGSFTIVATRPGSSPEDIELSITAPLEEEILKVNGLDKLLSNSMEGRVSMLVETNPDNTPEQNRKFAVDLRQAVDKANSRLPDDMPFKPEVIRHDPEIIPVMELLVHGSVSEDVLRRTARQIKTDLLQLPGVSGVNYSGYRNKEIKILLDPQKLHQLGIRYSEIMDAVRGRNVRDSGGSVSSYVSEQEILTVGQFDDPEELANVIVRTSGPANYVRIKDIGEVVVDFEDWTEQSLTDGRPGINLNVNKEADADGLTVSDRLIDYVANLQDKLPPGVEVATFNDTTRYTRSMLSVLVDNAIAGIILVFLVLLAFFPLNYTNWVVIGIPTAILLSFAFMPLFNITIDQTTIGALILMLGILVDDAIVISESIFQRREQGDSPIDAAINGTYEIAPPVLASAATTILAFAPILFLSGNEGKFMWTLPAMAMLVLAASLIEGKLMLPAHMAQAMKSHDTKAASFRRWYLPFLDFYQWWLRIILARRYSALIATTIAVMMVGFFSLKMINLNLYPDGDIDNIFVKVELPVGTSFEQTREAVLGLEQEVRDVLPDTDLLNIKTTVGNHIGGLDGGLDEGQQPSWAIMSIYLIPLDERSIPTRQMMDDLRSHFATKEDFLSIVVEPNRNTPPTGRSVEVDIIGNSDDRYLVADFLIDFLNQQEGVSDAWSSYSPGKDTVELLINHEAMADYNLTVSDLTEAVRIAFDGLLFDELQTVDERIKFRLQFKEPEQGNLDTLYGLSIINPAGERILLRNLVELVTKSGESTIRHFFGQRNATVYAEIDKSVISVAEINARLSSYIDDENLRQRFANLQIKQGGEVQRQQQALGSVGSAAILSLAGIVFLLVLLFNSVTQPVLVMMVIPLGIVGVLFAFALQGFDMSLAAMVGMVGLTGILVNDSLIMIDRLNRARADKHFLTIEEIVTNAASRLRPIFITTITTAVALFPAAYEIFGANPFLQPMIMAMLWGVVFGSLITLFYLPCLYAIEQDLRRLLQRLRGQSAPEAVANVDL